MFAAVVRAGKQEVDELEKVALAGCLKQLAVLLLLTEPLDNQRIVKGFCLRVCMIVGVRICVCLSLLPPPSSRPSSPPLSLSHTHTLSKTLCLCLASVFVFIFLIHVCNESKFVTGVMEGRILENTLLQQRERENSLLLHTYSRGERMEGV
jgi:hypothetical protein